MTQRRLPPEKPLALFLLERQKPAPLAPFLLKRQKPEKLLALDANVSYEPWTL